jgi:hypothetical protein
MESAVWSSTCCWTWVAQDDDEEFEIAFDEIDANAPAPGVGAAGSAGSGGAGQGGRQASARAPSLAAAGSTGLGDAVAAIPGLGPSAPGKQLGWVGGQVGRCVYFEVAGILATPDSPHLVCWPAAMHSVHPPA